MHVRRMGRSSDPMFLGLLDNVGCCWGMTAAEIVVLAGLTRAAPGLSQLGMAMDLRGLQLHASDLDFHNFNEGGLLSWA